MVVSALPPFQRVLDAHRDDVWRFLAASVGPVDADDCFQETFLAALRAYPRLRPDSNPRAWLLTIAHRKAIDSHRGRARRAVPVAEIGAAADARNVITPAGSAPWGASAASSAPSLTRDPWLWEAVHGLPPRQRAAVLLRHVADLPHREIAGVIGCSEEAARRSLHEGMKKLREAVQS
jgi:RNA polymerase sigma factor (sigma-70 family)